MEHINEIRTIIAPIKKIDFKIYTLEKSRQFLVKEKFYLREFIYSSIASIPPLNLYWSFNQKTVGEYCRGLSEDVQNIKYSIPSLISYEKNFENKQIFLKLVENELNNIIREDMLILFTLQDKFGMKGKEAIEISPVSLLENSLIKIYNFRFAELNSLIRDINQRVIPAPFKKQFKEENGESHRSGIKGFCWNKKRNLFEDLVILHTFLREYDFIDKNTSIKTLQNALSCQFIESPLGIKWIKKVKGKFSKGLLFHFIDQLEHFDLIDITSQNLDLFNKLKFIFCDFEGNELQNLEVSKSQWLNQRKLDKTPQELDLDNILYTLIYKKIR